MNKSKRNLNIQYLIWLMSTLLLSQNALADNKDENDIPWYQVEVIIFANQNYLGLSSETWPDPDPLDVTKLLELKNPQDVALESQTAASKVPNFQAGAQPAMPAPYELLEPAELQLVPLAKKLSASSKYKLLMHIAWRQPTLHPDKSIPIYIDQDVNIPISENTGSITKTQQPVVVMRDVATAGGKKGDSRFSNVPVEQFTYDSSQYGQLLPVTEADIETGPKLSPLYGTLRVSVSRYLHVEANLNYRMLILKEEVVPVETAQDTGNSGFLRNTVLNQSGNEPQNMIQKHEALQNFALRETRRMRSKEIHYFDNPVLGMIVRVIPYEIPKIEPNFDPASQAFKTGQGKTGTGTAPPSQKSAK